MNRHEKFAVFNLTTVVTAVLLFLLLFPFIGLDRATAAFALIGLTGLGHFLFLRRKSSSEVVEDERDRAIRERSSSFGYSISLAFFIIASLTVYYLNQESGVVTVDYFPMFTWFGWALYVFASSIVTIRQYRKGVSCGIC